MGLFNKVFGFLDLNQREVDRLGKTVARINDQEAKYKKLKVEDFKKETEKFKRRIENGETLESILPVNNIPSIHEPSVVMPI